MPLLLQHRSCIVLIPPPPFPPFLHPLGAGKTNIAMISVLREIGQNMRYGVIQKSDFKIVYVAPMKALAAEVTTNFGKRLEPLGGCVCGGEEGCGKVWGGVGWPSKFEF